MISANAIVSGQIGLSGSVHVGERVMMGGQVGVAPHLKIGDGAVLMARSGVTKNVAPGEQLRISRCASASILARSGDVTPTSQISKKRKTRLDRAGHTALSSVNVKSR